MPLPAQALALSKLGIDELTQKRNDADTAIKVLLSLPTDHSHTIVSLRAEQATVEFILADRLYVDAAAHERLQSGGPYAKAVAELSAAKGKQKHLESQQAQIGEDLSKLTLMLGKVKNEQRVTDEKVAELRFKIDNLEKTKPPAGACTKKASERLQTARRMMATWAGAKERSNLAQIAREQTLTAGIEARMAIIAASAQNVPPNGQAAPVVAPPAAPCAPVAAPPVPRAPAPAPPAPASAPVVAAPPAPAAALPPRPQAVAARPSHADNIVSAAAAGSRPAADMIRDQHAAERQIQARNAQMELDRSVAEATAAEEGVVTEDESEPPAPGSGKAGTSGHGGSSAEPTGAAKKTQYNARKAADQKRHREKRKAELSRLRELEGAVAGIVKGQSEAGDDSDDGEELVPQVAPRPARTRSGQAPVAKKAKIAELDDSEEDELGDDE